MAVTVVPNLTTISECDATTSWSGPATPTVDIDFYREATAALSVKVSNTTATYKYDYAPAGANLSNTHIYAWMLCASPKILDTFANGGLRIYVEDTSANWGSWKVGGSDYGTPSSWDCYIIDTARAFDFQSVTAPNMTLIRYIGVTCKITANFNKINFWWDVLRFGDGITIKGGTSADPGLFSQVEADSNADTDGKAHGVIKRIEGVYFAQGKLRFGSTTAGEATYFKDTSQVVVFMDKYVASGLYDVVLQGNGTASTYIYFGNRVGDAGVSGCTFRSVGAAKYKFTATDTNVTVFGLLGCSFFDAQTISLPASHASSIALSCGFEAGAEVTPNTFTIKNSNFISSDSASVLIDNVAFGITSGKFISCSRGVRINTGSTSYTFDNLKFSGNTYDIENSTNTTVIVNLTNGSDAQTSLNSGGTSSSTTIQSAYTLEATVKNSALVAIQSASVWIANYSTGTVLMNEVTNSTGVASEAYAGAIGVPVTVRVRRSSPGLTRYIPYQTSDTISGNLTLSIILYEDTAI